MRDEYVPTSPPRDTANILADSQSRERWGCGRYLLSMRSRQRAWDAEMYYRREIWPTLEGFGWSLENWKALMDKMGEQFYYAAEQVLFSVQAGDMSAPSFDIWHSQNGQIGENSQNVTEPGKVSAERCDLLTALQTFDITSGFLTSQQVNTVGAFLPCLSHGMWILTNKGERVKWCELVKEKSKKKWPNKCR